jgi:Paraquat-inducible protein A
LNRSSSRPIRPEFSCETEQSLSEYRYARLHRAESEKLRVRPGVNVGVVCVAVLIFIMVMIASCLPTFAFDIHGLVGVLASLGSGSHKTYSVYHIAQSLLDQARLTGKVKDKIGMAFISVLFVMTVVFVPIAIAVLLVVQWLKPMTASKRELTEIIIETLGSWQYIEVYILAVIVGSWQIGELSTYLLESYCEDIGGFLSQLVYYGIIEPIDAQCYRVDATIKGGSYFYVVICALLFLLMSFVGKAARQLRYFRESHMYAVLKSARATYMDEEPKKMSELKLKPVPILFTDQYRWLLQSDTGSSGRASVSEENSLNFDPYGDDRNISCPDEGEQIYLEEESLGADRPSSNANLSVQGTRLELSPNAGASHTNGLEPSGTVACRANRDDLDLNETFSTSTRSLEER